MEFSPLDLLDSEQNWGLINQYKFVYNAHSF